MSPVRAGTAAGPYLTFHGRGRPPYLPRSGPSQNPPVGAELASARNRGKPQILARLTGPGRRQAPPLPRPNLGPADRPPEASA